ncbi:CRACD-like protein [Aotus nancymaae]|uniref:CRACD-like protein n=1 Tax=Aotus nancymaae TaxID=37293 RepID=UPI0030FEDC35
MLGVLSFLRSFFKTPEPGAHLPGEGEIEDNQLPASPAEQLGPGWSQKTDGGDSETLSQQSESQSDTKTDTFESASDTESLTGDLPKGDFHPLRGTPGDTEAPWEYPDVSASGTPQEQHLTCVPGLRAKEELDLSPGLKEDSCENGFRAFAAVAGEEEAGHLWDCMTSLEQESLLPVAPRHTGCCLQGATDSSGPEPAQRAAVQDLRGLSGVSLQKSRSESYLGIPVVWPFLLWCCELGRSWPHIHNRARVPVLPSRGPLHSVAPLGTRTEKEGTLGPAGDTELLWSQPHFDVPSQPPLRTSCLLHTKRHHGAPGTIGDKKRASPRHYCGHTRALIRACSIAGLSLGCTEDPVGQNVVKSGIHVKEGGENERDPRTQNTLSPAPAQLSGPLPASQSGAPYLQGPCKPSGFHLQRASQDTPSEGLPRRENQLGQDSRSCLVASCLTSELVKLSAEAVPGPAECKSEQSPESRTQEPQGTQLTPRAADERETQKHLWGLSVEAGNPTSNYTSKYVLSGESRPPARAKFPRQPSSEGTQVWSGDLTGCSEVSHSSDAPETTRKSSAIDTSKAAEEAMVLDPKYRERALQGLSEFRAATVSHCGPGAEGAEQVSGGPRGRQLEPGAGSEASRGRGALITVSVEQEGLQATRRNAGPLPETPPRDVPGERPGSPLRTGETPWESPTAGKTASGNECEPPAAPTQGAGEGAPRPDPAAELGGVLVPGAASEETRSTDEPPGETLRGRRRSPGPGACGAGAALEGAQEPAQRSAFSKVTPSAADSPGRGGRSSGPEGVPAETPPAVALRDAGAGPELAPQAAGAGQTEPAARPGSRGTRRLRSAERKLRARLALAQKTLANFFEDTRERPPGSPEAEGEKRRLRQGSWRAFLKSKDAASPEKPALGSPPPGRQVPSPAETDGRGGGPARDKAGSVLGPRRAPPRAPAPPSAGPSAPPEHRRRSEPSVRCAAAGRDPPSGASPEQPRPAAPARSPPSRSARCAACDGPGTPCRPTGPKPLSPRPGAQRPDLRHPARRGAVSMLSLGSCSHVDSGSEDPERPEVPTAGTRLLRSLQTLDPEERRPGSRGGGPRPRSLPGSQVAVEFNPPECHLPPVRKVVAYFFVCVGSRIRRLLKAPIQALSLLSPELRHRQVSDAI